MPPPLQTLATPRLGAAVALLLASPAARCAAAGPGTAAWRQLRAAVEAFGGLVGVALIGLAALVTLLVVDHVISRRDPEAEPRVPSASAARDHADRNASR